MEKLILGCGYLGRRVANAWLAEGHNVSALTRSTTRAEELSKAGIRPIIGDICEPSTLSSLPAADTVLFAVGYDRASGRSQQEVYVEGLGNVLRSIVPGARHLIYISSTSVYGQAAGEWVDEDSECRPVQPGGECCLAAEKQVFACFPAKAAVPTRSPRANVLRLSGIYGPGRLLARVESLRAGEILAGRGDAWLNLIHVEDAVQAVLACERRGQAGRIYLVTDDQPVQRAEYYGLLAALTDAPPPRFAPEISPSRGSGGINKRCRNQRLREELKVALTYRTINDGLPPTLGVPARPAHPHPTFPAE